VLFLEHKHLLRQPYTRDSFPPAGWVVPVGQGDVRQAGTDLTVVSWGATVQKCLEAAAASGASVEVLDLRWLSPWDRDLVGESVARTGRALVVHEDVRTGGFGGEVAAWIAESCFEHLDAPVARIGAQDCHVAYEPTLEHAILPQVEGIAARMTELVRY
jgi:2-oxoisovalerate dehydrogenase E1 component